MKKILSVLVLIIFLVTQFSDVAFAKITNIPLTSDEIREVILSGVQWLKNSQESSGHFRYEYMPFLDRYSDDDNMVRQTGVLYILGEILRNDEENKFELKKSIEKAIGYFEKNSIKGKFNGLSFRCIVTSGSKCAVGASSLALIGILDLVETYPELESKYDDLFLDYLNYILAMNVSGNGFRNFYNTKKETQSASESPFGNGEAFLALARYYKYNSTEEVKNVIDTSFSYFQETYGENFDQSFYLWGMAAIKTLNEISPEDSYFEFTKKYTDQRISLYQNKRHMTDNKCGYIEGVVSAYSILENNISEEEKASYLEEINFWLTNSRDLQIEKMDSIKISVNDSETLIIGLKNEKKAVGGFLTSIVDQTQRIDFTQHCLSSYRQKLKDIDGGKF